MTPVAAGVGEAYDRAAEAWRHGPEPVYARLAAALLEVSPVDVRGARVLDVGAGTAVAGRAARERGAATVVAADLAAAMLRHRGPGILAVLGDAAALPFADGSFDLVTAAFSLSHVPDPGRALAELRRVGTAVVASTFPGDWSHPAKAVVDAVMVEAGFDAPPWYQQLKERTEPAVAAVDTLGRLAATAGFGHVSVVRLEVDSGLDSPQAIVAWRWGMAHLAPFVATLSDRERDRARARAERAVAGMAPVRIPMLALSAS